MGMTRDEAVQMVHTILGFRSDQTTNIINFMKLAQSQLELEPGKPWFLVSENLDTQTSPDEQRLGVPENMLEEYDDAALFWIPADGDDEGKEIELRKDEYDVLVRNYKDSDPGEPEAYALRGEYFVLFPTPDDAYDIRIIIYAEDDVLTSNIENKWLKYAPLLVMGKAGQYLAPGLRDQVALTTFKDWEQQGRSALYRAQDARELANRELQMGGPH
jgi:hypothetical protein